MSLQEEDSLDYLSMNTSGIDQDSNQYIEENEGTPKKTW